MRWYNIKQSVAVVASAVLLSGLAPLALMSAQAASAPTVEIQAPRLAAGNITIVGSADLAGQPATGVSVYDGLSAEAPYLADVTMGASLNPAAAVNDGFLLILDGRVLADGPHTLRFDARFAGGATESATAQVYVENALPYEVSDSGSSD